MAADGIPAMTVEEMQVQVNAFRAEGRPRATRSSREDRRHEARGDRRSGRVSRSWAMPV